MPGFIRNKKDEGIWTKAKFAVKREKGMSDEQYWAIVTSVYKKMGGGGIKKSMIVNLKNRKILIK